ncbi:MAG: dihydrofolate reductase [Rhodospirillales bacterium]
MRLALIVAIAENGIIGRGNGLPWHISGDLKHFKSVTMGKPVIMGRKTFDSIGKPLPGRANIVVTRDPSLRAEGVRMVHGFHEALTVAEGIARADGAEEMIVIGGAQIYDLALPKADRIYLTRIHQSVDGDVRFPEIDPAAWTERSRQHVAAGESSSPDYSFIVLERAV